MRFVSYAQNFEDIILWRALKHVEKGFYIDIGAQDPVVDSVSLAFYEHGWRGVHVEPNSSYASKLREARPDEEVIQAAIGEKKGHMAFWEFPGTGLSTGDPTFASLHKQNGHKGKSVDVRAMRLSKLLSKYRDRDIHWLKIDVEGMEREVIRSWWPAVASPWIVVVESTTPLTAEPAYADWEPLLLQRGYDFVYFDGLNRFYVSHAHLGLKEVFGPGPNVFDDAVLSDRVPFCQRVASELDAARLEVQKADVLLAESGADAERAIATQAAEASKDRCRLETELAAARAESGRLQTEKKALESHVAALYLSRSWRFMAPLRLLKRSVDWLAAGTYAWVTLKPGSRPRRMARHGAYRLASFLRARPRLARPVRYLLHRFPDMECRVRQILGTMPGSPTRPWPRSNELQELSPRARQIYAELKTAIERHHRAA